MPRSCTPLALPLLAAAIAVAATTAAEPSLELVCSPDRPVLDVDGSVALRAWARGPSEEELRYDWWAPVGRLAGRGSEASWDLSGVRPGSYSATVRVSGADRAFVSCALKVLVRGASRGHRPGRAFLFEGELEPVDPPYGVYSYLLLPQRPGAGPTATRQRYLAALEAFLSLHSVAEDLAGRFEPQELNLTLLPVRARHKGELVVEAAALLDGERGYDYGRALDLLRHFPQLDSSGPFLLSFSEPLSKASRPAEGDYLEMDLAWVPPDVVRFWVREFVNQAAQEEYWNERTLPRVALRLRTAIGVFAQANVEMVAGLQAWIRPRDGLGGSGR